jgi:formate-dependent nitrite reductase cytochrome c552 subunit
MTNSQINMKFKTHKILKNVQAVSVTRVTTSQPPVGVQRKQEQFNKQPIQNYNSNKFRSQYAECVHFLIKSDEYFCLKALPKQVRVLLEILT